jgi:hypothetical protein
MEPEIVHDMFVNFEARVANEVSKKILVSDYVIKNVNRKPWPANQGRTVTYTTFDRAGLPSGFLPFEAIAEYDTPSCDVPTVTAENFAATVRSVTQYHSATNTPNFCLRDLETAYEIEQQLNISVQNMATATKFNWGQELQNRYIALCGTKLIYTADVPSSSAWLATAPAFPLDWELLAYVYEQLRYIATPEDFAGVDEEGKVVFVAVGEWDAFNNLKLSDSNMRADIRSVNTAGQESRTLIGSPGMPGGKTYRGWKFETIQFAPHYDLQGGAWVQRYPYALEAKTVGNGLEIDPLYRDANFTDILVFSKSVFDHLVPAAPKSRKGYDWNADVDWMGVHKWRKLPIEKETNPDGAYGFWRSTYSYGPQLQRPDLGWTLRVQRCTPEFGKITCSVPGSI